MPKEEDLLYEEELLRNPYSLKMWMRYIQARTDASAKRRYLLFERALRALPGSYKLWHAYLRERSLAVRGLRIDHPAVASLNNTFERALVSMHKMPRIWTEYLESLLDQHLLTRTRRTFDRALCALPITQHERIWPLYLKFVRNPGVPLDTALRVYKRYLKLEPTHTEEFMAYLRIKERWGETARQLSEVLNDDTFRSLEGKSKHQLWLELCDIITKHPDDVAGIRVDAILRGGIRKFTDEVGRLWTSLADYYIRRSLFEKARDVYEEGLGSVVTVRDFSIIFDAYTQFEESLLSATMAAMGDEEEEEEPMAELGDGAGDGTDFVLNDDGKDLDLRLARLEHLMSRRPELLSSVMLRQNPHNVHEWHKRVKLFEGSPTRQILTFTEAVKTVDLVQALGKPHTLWVAFARFYERHGDVANGRVIFDKAVQVPFTYADDLATVWCEWAEMELRHKNFRRAIEVVRTATAEPAKPARLAADEERKLPAQLRVYRNVRLWMMRVDLEESLGSLDTCRASYDRILELRIATPQIVLNYALLLQEHKFFEDAFQVYERGVALFKYPHVKDIWAAYLAHFVERYGGKKLERARDLFEHALSMAPPAESKPIFLEYARLEEAHGLARHAMDIYERAARAVPKEQRMSVYDLYVAKASEFFGVGKVREIYETAIELEPPSDLPDADCKTMCLRYSGLERKLGEIDRARSILVHASALADPRKDKAFWGEWKSFEVNHGNEDTFREMLRIQRSVAAGYSHMQINSVGDAAILEEAVANQGASEPVGGGSSAGADAGQKRGRGGLDSMAALEREAEAAAAALGAEGAGVRRPALSGFVSAGIIQQKSAAEVIADAAAAAGKRAAANPEEIDMDGGEDAPSASAAAEEEVAVVQKAIPSAVFGSLAAVAEKQQQQQQEEEKEQLGALERFKKRKMKS
ncbi:MAG: hypothetical protein WDW36_002620 [Sanguina aurantia]